MASVLQFSAWGVMDENIHRGTVSAIVTIYMYIYIYIYTYIHREREIDR